ncbi:Wzy polymerase domain-containing protein [Serratia sp. 1D1416]|uniref:Wzy polymerase domain-containing protein n=1 Tax=Serratia sp. 1D1416 TaxID=2447890 RepID=UPI001013D09B|nr:Wzy polymerase domain-containing protein [Serratia sp. 1D1416]
MTVDSVQLMLNDFCDKAGQIGLDKQPPRAGSEQLYWLVDGGAVTAIGVVAWILLRQVRGFRSPRYREFPLVLALVLLGIHAQTEYPFYLSTPHWLLFILLQALLDRQTLPRAGAMALSRPVTNTARWGLPAIMLVVVAGCFLPGLNSGRALIRFERQGRQVPDETAQAMRYDPIINTERGAFDSQVHSLLTFNRTRGPQRLEGYRQWAQRYLAARIDRNVYANLIAIERAQGKVAQATQHRREAGYLFPDDRRFAVPSKEEGQ